MSEGFMRRSSSPPPPPAPAPLPDNDDILREILLRLPPLPSSLPRASLVCEHWRRLLSDARFLRRFRAFQHREPPGFFTDDHSNAYFTPTLEPPNRIPSARLSLALPRDRRFRECRRGLVLFYNETLQEFMVSDPDAGDQHHVAVPPGLFANRGPRRNCHQIGLSCDDHHTGRTPLEAFKVVCLQCDDPWVVAELQAFASVYESKTGVWSNTISTSITARFSSKPSILVGNSLCWLLRNRSIIEFDLDKQTLAVIDHPVYTHDTAYASFQILRVEDNRLTGSALQFC